jgi:hypothetical protein
LNHPASLQETKIRAEKLREFGDAPDKEGNRIGSGAP